MPVTQVTKGLRVTITKVTQLAFCPKKSAFNLNVHMKMLIRTDTSLIQKHMPSFNCHRQTPINEKAWKNEGNFKKKKEKLRYPLFLTSCQ